MTFEQIQDLIIAGWKSQTLFSALELGIFDCLKDGNQSLTEIATCCNIPPESGKKLLTACVALGLLEKQGETYTNNPMTQQTLVKGQPTYLGQVALHVRDIMPLWNRLTDAVRENQNQWTAVTGSNQGHFAQLYDEPAQLENFMSTMNLYNEAVAQAVAQIFNFSAYRYLLDVGGSTGIFDKTLLTHYPHLKATVFDLPKVCDITDRLIREQYHLSDRLDTCRGDFLQNPLPQGYDIIYLGWVLHDWSAEQQIQLLENCYQALPPGGVLLATECLLDEDDTGPLLTSLLSLDMLVSTDGGGESRGSEYQERFAQAGFLDIQSKKLPAMRDLLIGIHP
jgi:SAM-dependent methyltransferase